MEKHERKQFLEGVNNSAPTNVRCIFGQEKNKIIPGEHDYALTETIPVNEDKIYVRVLATGDGTGIKWAWDYAQTNHPMPELLQIVDLGKVWTAIDSGLGEMIDFH